MRAQAGRHERENDAEESNLDVDAVVMMLKEEENQKN
jgi:hypothetical protein